LEKFDFNVRLLDGQQINVNTTLIPTSLFDKGRYMKELEDQAAIDYDFFLRAGIWHDVGFYLITKSLLKYRIHRHQLSHKNITNTLSFLERTRKDVLSKVPKETRTKYLESLKEYQRKKPISKKSMEKGLKLFSTFLPSTTTDKLLVFYLNKIRRSR